MPKHPQPPAGTTQHQTHAKHISGSYRWTVTAAVILLLWYVLAPQTDALWRSLDILRQANWWLVALAIAATFMTYLLSADIYHMLLKHPVRLRTVCLVQAATALTSRVVPIGVGTMGLNALFLKRQRHSTAESLAVVAVNNGLGLLGHGLLLLAVLASSPAPPGRLPALSWTAIYWILLTASLLVAAVASFPAVRRRIAAGLRSLWQAIYSYRHQRRLVLGALLVSMLLSLVYVLALWASTQALGIFLPFNQIFLIYSFSLLTGAATPTPGGIIGVEAGLAGGLVAYGTPADSALAAALLYRLITYWLPLLPGFIAFRIVQHRYF